MSRDYQQFPDDENGNVLWQMFQDGDDLTEAHEIEFSIAFNEESQADRCALHLLKEEQKISEKQINNIVELMEKTKSDLKGFLGYFKIKEIPEMTTKQATEGIKMLENKLKTEAK